MPSKFIDWQTSKVIYLKEDPVYLKKDIVELHTEERWRRDGRQVIKESIAIRRVKGLYNDPEKVAQLFGIW